MVDNTDVTITIGDTGGDGGVNPHTRLYSKEVIVTYLVIHFMINSPSSWTFTLSSLSASLIACCCKKDNWQGGKSHQHLSCARDYLFRLFICSRSSASCCHQTLHLLLLFL